MQPLRNESAPPSLTIAMETIAAATGIGVAETSADMIRGRALRHYAEGLRQYLTIRLVGVEPASGAIQELAQTVMAWPAGKLMEPPSPRAQMYRLARDIAHRRLGSRAPFSRRHRAMLPWRNADPDAPPAYQRALEEVRLSLAEDPSELLELRYARELSPREIAFVLGMTFDEVDQELASAETEAERILGASPPSRVPGIAGALLEAFALQIDRNDPTFDEIDTRPSLSPGTVLGRRFTVDRRVGTGAFSDVYRAFDAEVPGHVVALKLLHQPSLSENARESALRELHLIASVFHPSVVHFKDHGWYDQRLWFVMPWYEGETLETRMNREPLSPAEARRIFEPLARALATLHAAGIRHQDIKPENIFLAKIKGFGLGESNVLPVLLDLGVAAREAEVLIAGTPMYFAPEVAARFASIAVSHPITQKADVFALALSLRNALEPDSQEDVPAAAVDAFIEHRATHIPARPRSRKLKYLEPCLRRWMSLDPNERPSADVLADELAFLTAPAEKKARRVALFRWLGPLAIALMVTFASVVYVLWKQSTFQKLEAVRARIEAEDAKAIASIEHSRRTALEEGNEDLQRKYESSTLSRHQLATELATAESQVQILGRSLSTSERRRKVLDDALAASQQKAAQLEDDLSKTKVQLAAESARAADLGNQVSQSRAQVAQLQEELGQSQGQAKQLSADLQSTRASLSAEQTKAQDFERRAGQAEAAKMRVEAEVAELKRRISALERELEIERKKNVPAQNQPAQGT